MLFYAVDWQMQHNLGNLLTQSYEEIAQSEAYRKIAATDGSWMQILYVVLASGPYQKRFML